MNSSPEPPAGVLPLDPSDPRYLGPFRLVGRLGAGGMGVVYAGLDDRDRRVAVKCVHRTLASDADFRARFAREVNLVRRVRAACVPAFQGADTKAEVPWLATDYVPGPTLDEYVRTRGPLVGDTLGAFALGVAEALTAIHANGVVHRDLKPGNVILSPDGPRVLDFGIARATDGTALTRTGGLVGTPGWISPEQYRGDPATERSDVFAWAGLVSYAATGQGPFGRGTSDVVVSRVLSEPPSLAGLPAHLHGVLWQALAKDPAQRPTAADLQRAVAGTLGHGGPEGRGDDQVTVALGRNWTGVSVPDAGARDWSRAAPPRRTWVRRNRSALGVAAAVLVLALVAGVGLRALLGGQAPEAPGADGPDASGDAAGGNTAAGNTAAGVPDDAPEEYRGLYESGETVVEPASDDAPVLIRRLEPASGEGEALDLLRVTYDSVTNPDFENFGLNVDLEYLPDHGSLRVHSDEFVTVRSITPGQESLDFVSAINSGLLAELDPENPTARVRLVFYGPSVVYHVPSEITEQARSSVDYPGGFCVRSNLPEDAAFPGMELIGPHDTTLTGGEPLASCAYTEDLENQ